MVDLFTLVPPAVHPHGLPDEAFDALFTADKPVLFNFHGYPALIHRLCYRRRNHAGFHVHGYREEGDLNTPFELAVLNGIDRYSLAMDVLERVPRLRGCAPAARERLLAQRDRQLAQARAEGLDRKRFAMAGGPTKGWRMRDGRARARRRKPAPIGPPALGAGLITGAADDDPSGIATYSQAGAQFGYAMLWTMPLTLPLMVAIQLVSARIGCVTRRGLAANIKRDFPPIVLWAVVGLLLTANTLNLAADIAAMAQAVHLVAGGPVGLYAAGFGALSLTLQVYMRYQAYVRWLKWLTLALLAYVAVAFTVEVDWPALIRETALPGLALGHDALLMIVAVFGTTISPICSSGRPPWRWSPAMMGGRAPGPACGHSCGASARIPWLA